MKKAFALALVMLFALSGVANAAPNKYNTTISVNPTSPAYGQPATFTVDSTAPHSFGNLLCYQNGSLVLSGGGLVHYKDAAHWTDTITMRSPSYQGGVANCEYTVRTWKTYNHYIIIGVLKFNTAG